MGTMPGTGAKLLVKPDWFSPAPGMAPHYRQKLALNRKYTPSGGVPQKR